MRFMRPASVVVAAVMIVMTAPLRIAAQTSSLEVNVAAGQTLPVSAPLVALLVAAPPVPLVPPVPGPDDGDDGLSAWFWTCIGVAGASALTMAITGGLTLKYNDDFDAGGRTEAGLRDTTVALRTTTDVFLGIGLAAVIAGTVLFFVEPEETPPSEGPGSNIALLPSGVVVWW